MVITQILEKNRSLFGDDVCLVEVNPDTAEKKPITWKEYNLIESDPLSYYSRELTWRQFDETANRFANLLLAKGVKKGEKVAILLMNCLEWLPIYFGILKAGAVAVPLNFRYTSDEIEYCLKLSDSSVLVFGLEFIGRLECNIEAISKGRQLFFVGEGCPPFAESYHEALEGCSSAPPKVAPPTLEDDSVIYFSSGTTGFPKAILHKHQSLIHACETEQNHHGQSKDDVFLCIPPLYHTGATMHWMGSFYVGGKGILLKGVKPAHVLEAISKQQCTVAFLLVPWVQDLLDAIDSGAVKLKDYELAQWRLMHIGAQPVPPSLIHRWKKIFPGHMYDTNYGLSESIGPGCVHLGIENIHKVGAIGKAGYKWETEIVDEKGSPVKKGDVGELIVKGPGLMTCYYNDPAATAETLKDGWLYTGDMAMEDEDGFIFLVDRKKDVVISGGENIYPVQIEAFLRGHEAIKDAAVIGVPDQRLGETCLAVLECKEGFSCTEEEIREFCLALPRYKRPNHIVFADIPRNPTGKIEKPKLRKIYGGEALVAAQIRN